MPIKESGRYLKICSNTDDSATYATLLEPDLAAVTALRAIRVINLDTFGYETATF